MQRHSSPYSIPALVMLAVLLLARLARASEALPPPPPPPPEAELPASSTGEAGPAQAPPKSELSRVALKDGQVLRGKVLSRDAGSTTLELAGGGRLVLDSSSIQSVAVERDVTVGDEGNLRRQDPNRTRYLYAPSAMMLRQGEGYFSQKELVFSSASVGITDHFSVLAGAVLPAWAASGGMNFIFALKGGLSVTDNLHLAAGVESLVLPGTSAGGVGAGFYFGTATVGNPDHHVSLSVGRPFAFAFSSQVSSPNLGEVLLVVGGNARINDNLALVTENWLLPTTQVPGDYLPFFMVNSLALRFLLDRWSIDLGALRVPLTPIPIPWVDFSYHWG